MRPFQLIVSCAENRVIGRGGKLPWNIPEDRRFFHEQTAGAVVVMGRVCFQTWPGAGASGRRPVVVSRDLRLAAQGARVVPSLAAALAVADPLPGPIYICGGERIYREALSLPEAERLYLTLVHAEVEGDTRFPDWRAVFSRTVSVREGADAQWRYSFLTLER